MQVYPPSPEAVHVEDFLRAGRLEAIAGLSVLRRPKSRQERFHVSPHVPVLPAVVLGFIILAVLEAVLEFFMP